MDENNTNKKAMDQAALLSYIEDLIRDRKDPTINDQNKDQVKVVLLKQINEDINMHLVNLLPEKEQIALDELLDKNPSDDELNQFFSSKIPNLESEMAAVLLNFRAAYLLPVTSSASSGQVQANKVEEPVSINPVDMSPPPPPPPAPVPPSPEEKFN